MEKLETSEINSEITINDIAKNEFTQIIEKYILPLICVKGEGKCKLCETSNTKFVEFKTEKDKNFFYFYPCIPRLGDKSPYYYKIGTYSNGEMEKKLANILRELVKVAEYTCYGKIHKQRDYGNRKLYKTKNLELAFELGMCSSLVAPENSELFYSVVCRMQEWAEKTYEGKNVPFGILINFDKISSSPSKTSFVNYLACNSSAVFTDGIFSGILLDKDGNIDSFLTRELSPSDEENLKTDTYTDVFSPYQFSDIAKRCVKNTIGIVVMTNGEILLFKNRSLCFAKRSGKWVAFDWRFMLNAFKPYFAGSDFSDDRIREIVKTLYISALDVSFSHTGGCIGIITEKDDKKISEVIKRRLDMEDSSPAEEDKDMRKGLSDDSHSSINESKEKKKVVQCLLSDTPFYELNRQLRKELLSLDGALAFSIDGSITYCVGEIVSVSKASKNGGGRSTAALRLAELGIGIKISEDGYIEAYGKRLSDEDSKSSKTDKLFVIK